MLPFICYEIIFPGEAVPSGERPGWLINLTNDGWFGISSGPYQHLQQARVRAIEQGLPLVRAANTGISAVIDPLGRIVKSLPLGTEGVLDASLPRRIDRTLYARTGDGGVATGDRCGLDHHRSPPHAARLKFIIDRCTSCVRRSALCPCKCSDFVAARHCMLSDRSCNVNAHAKLTARKLN